MDDLNSQVQDRENGEENIMGTSTYRERNERGWKLIQFCRGYTLRTLNTYIKRRKGKDLRRTSISPNRIHKNQIDYILALTHQTNI